MLKCCEKNQSDYQPLYAQDRSNDCSDRMKTHKVVMAIFAVIAGTAALAVFCFDKQNMTGGVLSPKVYDYLNLGVSGALLLRTAIRSTLKLKDPKEAGVCSYEFSMTAMAIEIAIYSVVFFSTQEQTDVNRSLIYGFSLGMLASSFVIAGVKHCRAKPSDLDEKSIPRIAYSEVQ